jgi:Spy/CpxP family protein refolding chaperone
MGKTTISIVTTFFAIFLFSLAFASDWGRGRSYGPGHEGDITTISGLELTDEQIVQIKALRAAHLVDVRPLLDKISKKRKELKELWLETTPDQDKIAFQQNEFAKLRDMLQDKIIAHRQAIFRIMTPEQQQKLQAAIQQRKFNPGPRWRKKSQGSQGTAIPGN